MQIIAMQGAKHNPANDIGGICLNGSVTLTRLQIHKDYVSGCGAFSFNSQSVSLLQAYLRSELLCSALLAETGSIWCRPRAWTVLIRTIFVKPH